MPHYLVENADKTLRISHLEADDEAHAAKLADPEAKHGDLTVTDQEAIEKAYWAAHAPPAAATIAVPAPKETAHELPDAPSNPILGDS